MPERHHVYLVPGFFGFTHFGDWEYFAHVRGVLAAWFSAQGLDVVIFDTAGRLAIDAQLMDELEQIRRRRPPDNTLLVIDAMIGQDAVQTAKAFNDKVGIDGVVLTKLDGDARGGAALSVKLVTGAPIKFVGMGEGLDKLEEFRPEGLASRILGMGDIVGLMSDFEKVIDEEKAEKDAEKLLSGKFGLDDFMEQIKTLKKMGSLRDVMEKLPFFSDMQADGAKFDEKELGRIEAALTRAVHGGFGSCCRCHEAIDADRLRADPAAPLCIDCIDELAEERREQELRGR